jgi:DNA-binding transcriptional MerR regulator
MVSSRTHLSIGDVLTLLREEFPDVTISKIRFLESQGLVNPERSPSGYRKFYDHDVERLRWVLQQQREHFLPLKVIRDRLVESGGRVPDDADSPAPGAVGEVPARSIDHDSERVVSANGDVDAASADAPSYDPALAVARSGATRMEPAAAPRDLPPDPRSAAGPVAVPEEAELLREVGRDRLPGFAAAPAAPGVAVGGASTAVPAEDVGAAGEPLPTADLGTTPIERSQNMTTASGPKPPSEPGGVEARVPDTGGSSADFELGSQSESARQTGRGVHAAAESSGGGEQHEGQTPASASASTHPPAVSGAATAGGGAAGTPEQALEVRPGEVANGVGRFDVSEGVSGVSLTVDELCAATGLSHTDIATLESFGLVESTVVAGIACFDETSLAIATLASQFSRYGVEPRHLRLYRNAVERESGLVEQIVMPLLRQRNPEARQRALDAASDLASLGQSLRGALLRKSLRDLLG